MNSISENWKVFHLWVQIRAISEQRMIWNRGWYLCIELRIVWNKISKVWNKLKIFHLHGRLDLQCYWSIYICGMRLMVCSSTVPQSKANQGEYKIVVEVLDRLFLQPSIANCEICNDNRLLVWYPLAWHTLTLGWDQRLEFWNLETFSWID